MKEHVLAVGSVDGNRRLLHFANRMHKSGKQKMREHVLSGRPTSGFASRTDRFCCSIIRVRPPQEVRRERLCEHLLSDKFAFSIACKSGNFCGPINRVRLTLGGGFYIIIDVFLSVLSGRL